MKKKSIMIPVFVIITLLMIVATALCANAAGSFNAAFPIAVNTEYSGNIADKSDNDYYIFALSEPGIVSVTFSHEYFANDESMWEILIYDVKTNEICLFDGFKGINSTTTTYDVGLDAGTYYLRIRGSAYNESWNYSNRFSTATYTFTLNFSGTEYCEKENNESLGTSTLVTVNNGYRGSINDKYDNDYYKFVLTEAGIVNVTLSHEYFAEDESVWDVLVYDVDTNEICTFSSFSGVKTEVTTCDVGLDAGTYYLRIRGSYYNESWNYSQRFSTATYTFTLNFSGTEYCEKENNEGFGTSTLVTVNNGHRGSINDKYDNDYYKFVLTEPGVVNVTLSHDYIAENESVWDVLLYDVDTNEICSFRGFSGVETDITSYDVGLDAGTYYLRIRGSYYYESWNYSDRFSTATYTFTLNFKATEYCEKENNEKYGTATEMVLNHDYYASVNDANDNDYFKVTVSSSKALTVVFKNNPFENDNDLWQVEIYDQKINKIAEFNVKGFDAQEECHISVNAGTYYIHVKAGRSYYSWNTYRLQINDGTSPIHQHEYVADVTKPTCTEKGYTTYTCSDCGDSYVGDYVKALGHKWGKWKVTSEPDVGKAGKETRKCSRCGAKDTRKLAALPGDAAFTDVPDDSWFTEGALYCNDKGYMAGVAADRFAPGATLTRAMFVTILAKIDKADTSNYIGVPFKDVPAGKWYSKPVMWAYASGYASGTGGGNFSPNAAITRETLAQFFYTYSRIKGYNVSKTANLGKYSDSYRISGWARNAVSWAVACGLISGTSATTVSPKSTATRAQVALIVMNYVENIAQ